MRHTHTQNSPCPGVGKVAGDLIHHGPEQDTVVEANVEVELSLYSHLPVPALRAPHLTQAQALRGVRQRLAHTVVHIPVKYTQTLLSGKLSRSFQFDNEQSLRENGSYETLREVFRIQIRII